jgi:hypothetical protein
MTGELLTLPRPFSAVRCHASMQLDSSCSSTDVARECHAFVRLAVNLAVSPCPVRWSPWLPAWPASSSPLALDIQKRTDTRQE